MPAWEIAALVFGAALTLYILVVVLFFGVILRLITKSRREPVTPPRRIGNRRR